MVSRDRNMAREIKRIPVRDQAQAAAIINQMEVIHPGVTEEEIREFLMEFPPFF